MTVSITYDFSGLDRILGNIDAAQANLVEMVMQDSSSYVPVRTGSLRGSATAGQQEVTWNEDYAAYVYHGTSRMVGRPWAEQAAASHMEAWVAETASKLGVR